MDPKQPNLLASQVVSVRSRKWRIFQGVPALFKTLLWGLAATFALSVSSCSSNERQPSCPCLSSTTIPTEADSDRTIDSHTSEEPLLPGANGAFDFSSADTNQKEEIYAKLEEYALRNHNGGIPLAETDSCILGISISAMPWEEFTDQNTETDGNIFYTCRRIFPSKGINFAQTWELFNHEFLDGLFFAVDRQAIAEAYAGRPSLGVLPSFSSIDGTNLIADNPTRMAAIDRFISEAENNPYAYSEATAIKHFAASIASFEQANVHLDDDLGTLDMPLGWANKDEMALLGPILKECVERAFNKAGEQYGYRLNVRNIIPSNPYECLCSGGLNFFVTQFNYKDSANTPLSLLSHFSSSIRLNSGYCFNWVQRTDLVMNDRENEFIKKEHHSIERNPRFGYPIVFAGQRWSYDGLLASLIGCSILKDGDHIRPLLNPSCSLKYGFIWNAEIPAVSGVSISYSLKGCWFLYNNDPFFSTKTWAVDDYSFEQQSNGELALSVSEDAIEQHAPENKRGFYYAQFVIECAVEFEEKAFHPIEQTIIIGEKGYC